jgi:hypothetical protein
VTDCDGAARVRYDLRSAGRLSQRRFFRQRHAINGQNSDTTDIFLGAAEAGFRVAERNSQYFSPTDTRGGVNIRMFPDQARPREL